MSTVLRLSHSTPSWFLPAGIYCAATAMDLLTSAIAFGLSLQEGNPAAAPFIHAYGFGPQVGVSIFICAVLTWYASRGGGRLVYVLAGIRWLVVVNNVVQLILANR